MAPPQRPILAMVLVCTFSLVVFFAAQEDATGSVLESNYHSQMVYSQVSNAIDQGENVNVKGAISSVAPQRGPSSGGTLLTIMGRDFTTGDEGDVTRVLLHGIPAHVKEVREGFMVVQAAPLDLEKHSPGRGSVKVYSRHMGLKSFKHGFHYLPPMAVLQVTPDNGPHKGGTTVTITGRNLCSVSGSPTGVHLAGQEAKFLSCHHGGTSLVVRTTPLAASARGREGALELLHEELGNIKVAKAFRYNTAPMVSRISPVDGPAQGGNRVRLEGAMLTAGREEPRERVTVDVGGKPARVLEYNPNSVLVEMPPGEGGKRVEVTVNSALQGIGVSRQTYHYLHPPHITTLEPRRGAAHGGTKLVIHGHHLGHGDVTMVTIGETRAKVLSAARDGRKVIVLTEKFSDDEAGEALPVEMHSTSHGKAVTVKGQSFTVARAPRIFKVTPHGGPLQGNTLVTIRGADLCDDVTMVAATVASIENPEPSEEEDDEEEQEEGDVVSRLWQKTEDQVKLQARCTPGDIAAVHLAGATAELVEASPEQIIVRAAKGGEAHRGSVHVVSQSAGEAHSPHSVAYEYHSPPQIRKLSPATGSPTGGELITLHGSHLCTGECHDLHRVRIGDSLVTEFVSKSPETVTFRLPKGLPGWSTVVAESVLYGRGVAPASFLYQHKQVGKFTATPTDVPLTGGTFVEIHGENLLHAKHTSGALSYTVLLAGVPAKVLSASATKILTQAGDASAHCAKLGSACHHGVSGTIMIHQDGTSTAFDTAIPFKYNAPCVIRRLETPRGDTSGRQLTLFGRYLGLGDEEVRVNGQLVTVTARHRRLGAMVTRLSLALQDPMENDTPHVQISSKRGGACSWPLAKPPAPHSTGAAAPPAAKPHAHAPLKLASVKQELAARAQPQAHDTPAQQQAYTMFLEEVKQGWESAVGDAPVDEHAKMYWDAMSDEDKKIYQARAEAARTKRPHHRKKRRGQRLWLQQRLRRGVNPSPNPSNLT